MTGVGAVPESSAIIDAARAYVRRGWPPIPVPFRTKRPVLNEWQRLRIDEAQLPRYFDGHPQNIGVLLGEPSGGLVDVDLDAPEAVRAASILLPRTDAVFGRPGKPLSHRLFACKPPPKTVQFRDPQGAMLVELRGTGGQTVFPPSIHESGEQIEWTRNDAPTRIDANDLRTAVARVAAAALIARQWPAKGSRHDAGLALAGGLLRAGWAELEARNFIQAVAVAACDEEVEDRVKSVETTRQRLQAGETVTGWPTLAEKAGGKIVKRVQRWLAIKSGDQKQIEAATPRTDGPHETDVGNAARFAAKHGENIRYCAQFGKWLVYRNGRWAEDATGEVWRLARDTLQSIYVEAVRQSDSQRRDELLKHAKRSEAYARINAMLLLAQSELRIAVAADSLDTAPWLFNVRNGTIDLRTGQLRQHRREDLITKIAPVKYDPRAACPRWLAFLNEIMGGSEALIGFLQRVVGYALTGDITEQILVILYGTGSNGKSVFLDTISGVMGDYAGRAPPDLLTVRRNEEHPTQIADLFGKRLVVASETERDKRLRVQFVKETTGDATLKGRYMRRDYFEFPRTHKTFLATNNKPVINENTHAIWRRIRLIPFVVTIPDERQDRRLLQKLREEWPGILRWLVEGCLKWQIEGLDPPVEVRAATEQYRSDMDDFAQWLAECCVEGPDMWAWARDLLKSYREFTGDEEVTPKSFGEELRKRGYFKDKKGHENRVTWKGIGLRS